MVDQLTRPAAEHSLESLLPIPPAPFPYLWFSGRQIEWERAAVHVSFAGWPAISGVFEGIRGYWNSEQNALYIFRLSEHMRRLDLSMKLQRMAPRWTAEYLTDELLKLVRANNASGDIYLQPLAFMAGATGGGRAAQGEQPEIVMTVRPNPSALLTADRGIHAGISSWTRINDTALPPRIKALPNYANSRLGSNEAQRHGYDAPIFLNQAGKVAESSGSCIAIIRNGRMVTPPVTASILESITRDSLIELVRDAVGMPVEERDIDRTELYAADEAFLCGTAMEVTPITRIDGYTLGSGECGPVTTRVEQLYHDVVRGMEPRYMRWLTRV